MNTVVFAHTKEKLPQNGLLPNKKELFSKLMDRDIRPVVSYTAENAFNDSGVEVNDLVSEEVTHSVGHIALDEVGVIVNRLDRSFKEDLMPNAWNESHIPISNENTMRSLVFKKHRVQNEVLEPLGLGMPSLLVDSPLGAALFMQKHPVDHYIVKPTSGTFSKGVERLSRDDVLAYISTSEKVGSVIIQPAFDFTHPLPESMQPFDAASKDDFEMWAQSNVTKELRMYGFFDGNKTNVFPVGRAMKDGQDHWFFIDPETVPDKLTYDTERVISRAAHLTGSRAIYAALDIGYGNSRSNEAPDYHVVELNGRMPYMIGYDKHAGVADILRDTYADQLQIVANQTAYRKVE